jgi:hypothetical protein
VNYYSIGLTGFRRERAPAAMAVAEDVVAELLVLLRRPQALPVVGLWLLARLAPHCQRMSRRQRAKSAERRATRQAAGGGEGEEASSLQQERRTRLQTGAFDKHGVQLVRLL